MVSSKICRGHTLKINIGLVILTIFLLVNGAEALHAIGYGERDKSVIIVDKSGGGEYKGIQEAIDYANEGDTIFVLSGTYYENVIINTPQITLRGIDTGGGKPVVNANGSLSPITLNAYARYITIDGFIVANSGRSWPTAGILVYSNNNIIRNNSALNNSYGIFLDSSNNNILNVNNASNNVKGGIFLKSSSNNTLTENFAMNNDIGIDLSNSNNNILSNITVSNNHYGIFLGVSSNNILNGSIVLNNTYGISLGSSSNNNLISDNTVLNNNNGIGISNSKSNMVSGNNASNNSGGISISGAQNNTIKSNFVNSNRNGIALYGGSNNNTFIDNIMKSNKYNLEGSELFDNNIDPSNQVDGKPIYIIKSAANNIYDSSSNAGIFYCIDCVNITVKDLNFNNNSAGIFFWNTSESKIQNVSVSNNIRGIYLYSSINNTFIGNNANSNELGIYLFNSSNNVLNNNTANSNVAEGIYLFNSSNNVLNNNTANSNRRGIELENSNNNMLINNNGSLNNESGIFIIFSNNIDIFNNTVNSNNRTAGIFMQDSSNSTLRNNTVIYNINSGIYMGSSTGNCIIFNNLLNNMYNIVLDSDNVSIDNNIWANPSGTGFSQTCTDNDKNGICDAPYVYNAYYMDHQPLVLKPAIVQQVPTKSPTATTIEKTTGFEVIMAITALLLVYIFRGE